MSFLLLQGNKGDRGVRGPRGRVGAVVSEEHGDLVVTQSQAWYLSELRLSWLETHLLSQVREKKCVNEPGNGFDLHKYKSHDTSLFKCLWQVPQLCGSVIRLWFAPFNLQVCKLSQPNWKANFACSQYPSKSVQREYKMNRNLGWSRVSWWGFCFLLKRTRRFLWFCIVVREQTHRL